MTIFLYDNVTNTIKIDEYGILLVKEFAELWDQVRNRSKADPDGSLRLKAYRELAFIYLMLDFKSPYFQYLEKDKHEAALADTNLKEEDTQDEIFKSAFNKYKEIIEADSILSLIKTAYKTMYKMQVFLDNIDFNNDVDENGKPLYKPADVIKDIGSIAKMRRDLQELELEHKKGLAAQSRVRGDQVPGFLDI